MNRPITKRINLPSLIANWHSIRRQAKPKKLLATVKSNAYGHGLPAVVKQLGNLPDGYAVVDITDAITIRQLLPETPILLLQGIFHPAQIKAVVEHKLTPTIHSEWQLNCIKNIDHTTPITVYIKCDTGMNRLGFPAPHAPPVITQLQQCPAVSNIVLSTHFANADQPDGLKAQLAVFNPLRHAYPQLQVSLSNSAASLLHDDISDNWGRIGIALYGASPAPLWRSRDALNLQPLMTLTAQIIATKTLQAGDSVGYGSTWRAPQTTPIAIVGIGYGDGYPRANNLYVSCEGQHCPVLGRVSMEMIAIDITPCPAATVGTPVTLWGDSPAVDDIAQLANTISYNLLTATGHLAENSGSG